MSVRRVPRIILEKLLLQDGCMIYHSCTEISQNRTVVSRLLQTKHNVRTRTSTHFTLAVMRNMAHRKTSPTTTSSSSPPYHCYQTAVADDDGMATTLSRSGCYRINRRRWRLCSDIASRDIPGDVDGNVSGFGLTRDGRRPTTGDVNRACVHPQSHTFKTKSNETD